MTKAALDLEERWVGKLVRCKALRGAALGSGQKPAWEEWFTGTVKCIHTDEAESSDAWIRPTGKMSVEPDEILYSIEEDVRFENAMILDNAQSPDAGATE